MCDACVCAFPLCLFRGENLGCQTQEVLDQVETLKAQISELERKEMELDSQKAWLEQNITHMNEDSVVSRYLFLLKNDLILLIYSHFLSTSALSRPYLFTLLTQASTSSLLLS